MRGCFITIEGGEGVGKSSFIEGLTKALRNHGKEVLKTFEPGGTPLADKLRELFVNPPAGEKLSMEAEFCMVSAARAQHVLHKILPALEKGTWVLSDRYADSARIYQGVVGGVNEATLEAIIMFTTFGLEPDLTFILDCDLSVSRERLNKRCRELGKDAESRFDKGGESFHRRVREGFLALANSRPQRFAVLDAGKAPEAVVLDALRVIKERLLADRL